MVSHRLTAQCHPDCPPLSSDPESRALMQPVVHPLHPSCFFLQRATLLLLLTFPVIPDKPAAIPHSTYHISHPAKSKLYQLAPSCASVPNCIPLMESRGSVPAFLSTDGDHKLWLILGVPHYQSYTCYSKYNRPTCIG